MNLKNNDGPAATEAADTPFKLSHSHYTSQEVSRESMHGVRKSLTQHGSELAESMKGHLPAEPIEAGKVYQLPGKALQGVDCLILLVIPDNRAVCIDLSTGVVGSVDRFGVRKTMIIGGRQ